MGKDEETVVYAYEGCDTCKKALRWLAQKRVVARVIPIVESPPTKKQLATWIEASGLPVRKWLNTSGQSYRAMIAERGAEAVAEMSDAALIAALAADGKLIKRPVMIRGDRVLVGFKEDAYSKAFSG